ncbi:MAG: outer membrane protein (OmpH-like) [Candidatus Aminicenantes bacterium]|nr:outer membrane protein (OmpH-like) [Candidatus Aminicenantes bacterium]
MKRHIRTLALIALAAAGLSGLALAQDSKMGMLNSQEILEKSVEGKRALAQVQAADKAADKKYADDIAKLDEQIKQLQNRLSTQRTTLTPDAAMALQTDIQKKQTERQRAIEDASRGFQEIQARTLERIQSDLIPIIEQVRKDKGLDLIFDVVKGGAVYFTPALDLTAEVIKRYDALKAAPAKK